VKHGCPNNICCNKTGTGPSGIAPKPDQKKVFSITGQKARFTVSFKQAGRHSLQVLDINGKLIESKHGEGAKAHKLSNLKPGLYFVILKVGDWQYTQKIVANF
jgi:hypothetical protein